MKEIFSFEHYVIVNNMWSLINNYRLTEYDKRKKLTDLKRNGYKYDRKEKAYILEPDPVESVYKYAVVVKKYYV